MGDQPAGGHRFNPTILREYDVRGVVGETLGETDARAIGQSFAVVMREAGARSIAVGRDGRLSSPALEAALIGGLLGSGIDVVRVGLGPTPMLYYAANTLDVDAAIMVTGSHNPPTHNGFKLTLAKKPFFARDILRLGEIAARGNFPQGAGRSSERSVLEGYVERLLKDYGVKEDEIVSLEAAIKAEVQEAVRFAEQSPEADANTVWDYVYANPDTDPRKM